MSQLKYIFVLTDTITKDGRTLTRIKALRAFDDVAKDDLGGYIQQESNLDNRIKDENNNDLDAWIYSDNLATPVIFATAMDESLVNENGKMRGDAEISGNFLITDGGLAQGNFAGFQSGIIAGGGIAQGDSKITDGGEVSGSASIGDRVTISRFVKVYGTAFLIGTQEPGRENATRRIFT